MANNIVELVGQELSPHVVGRLATVIGESPDATARAASTAAPVILAGIAQRASTEAGAADVLRDIRAAGYDKNDIRSPIDAIDDPSARQQVAEHGRSILSSAFENRQDNLLGAVAGAAGLKKGALGILMSLLAPVVMRTIGKQVRDHNLDAKGLHAYLGGQRAAIASVLPSPLGKMLEAEHVEQHVGAASLPAVAHVPSRLGRREEVVERKARPLWPFLAALLVAMALFTMMRSPRRPPALSRTPVATPEPAARVPEAPTIQPPVAPSVQMPSAPAIGGGPYGELKSPAEGVRGLAVYLATGGASGQKNDFVLEGVTFTTASANLSKDGADRVNELAVLLKGHPQARIKVVGHTDNTGDSDANRALSQDRANAVRDELVRQGIASDRIETAGAGSDNPITKNDSSANNMEKNRRIDVIVVSP